MAQRRKLYNVYKNTQRMYNGLGVDQNTTQFVGQTMAVSEKQAANNVAFRNGEKPYKEVPMYGDGVAVFTYYAKEA
jgi:hypothetical protein